MRPQAARFWTADTRAIAFAAAVALITTVAFAALEGPLPPVDADGNPVHRPVDANGNTAQVLP